MVDLMMAGLLITGLAALIEGIYIMNLRQKVGKELSVLLECANGGKLMGILDNDQRQREFRTLKVNPLTYIVENVPEIGQGVKITPDKVVPMPSGIRTIWITPDHATGIVAADVKGSFRYKPGMIEYAIEQQAEERSKEDEKGLLEKHGKEFMIIGILAVVFAFAYLIIQYAGQHSSDSNAQALLAQCMSKMGMGPVELNGTASAAAVAAAAQPPANANQSAIRPIG